MTNKTVPVEAIRVLIRVSRMPNIEHIADAHNQAVKKLNDYADSLAAAPEQAPVTTQSDGTRNVSLKGALERQAADGRLEGIKDIQPAEQGELAWKKSLMNKLYSMQKYSFELAEHDVDAFVSWYELLELVSKEDGE